MVEWNLEKIAARFDEAAQIAHRLPPARAKGYFSVWPAIVRMQWEVLAHEEKRYFVPPAPDAIERMSEVMHWVQWLSVEQRHLVWMRAEHYRWRDISRRFGCNRTTAWRRWQQALDNIVVRLNGGESMA